MAAKISPEALAAMAALGRQTNLLDRAITWVSPSLGAKRLAARAQLAMLGGYTGARIDRATLANWRPLGGSANADTIGDLPTLRARSRDQMRNAPVAGGALEMTVSHVVGTGLALKPSINPELLGLTDAEADDWQKTTLARWTTWAQSVDCDLSRRLNFYGLQALAFRSGWESGDCFVLTPEIVREGVSSLTLQVIEADRVCNPNRTPNTERLIDGIEINPDTGEPVRVHVARRHPGDAIRSADVWDSREWRGGRTGRRNVLQIMRQLRPGQVRGVPWVAPILEPLKQINRYTDAELNSAVVSSVFSVFVKMDPNAFQDIFDEGAREAIVGQATQWSGEMESGKAVNLLPGESIETAAPGRPNAQFDPFVTSVMRQIGMALQIPYEVLVMHFQSSYSAARGALLMAWRTFRGWRDLLSVQMCQPVYETWLAKEIAEGRIRAPGFFTDSVIRAAWCSAQWIGDGPGSIDPQKEVAAAEARVQLGISTLDAESILHDGIPWADKERQRKIEVETQRRNGTAASATTPQTPAPQQQTAPADNAAPPAGYADLERLRADLAHDLHAHQAQAMDALRVDLAPALDRMQDQLDATLDKLNAAPPVINNYVNLPEQTHEHHTHVAAPGVTFSPVIQTPEPHVTVEAHMPEPQVVVEATIQPAPVTVAHPKVAVQTVEREGDEIVRTVTRYDDGAA